MLLGAFCLVIALALTIFLWLMSEGNDIQNVIAGILAVIMTLIVMTGIIAYYCLGWDWHAAKYKTDIINREYGTAYTQEEVFYANDVIDTIQELARERIEINGNILRGTSKKETAD